jgi:hypothetical protein
MTQAQVQYIFAELTSQFGSGTYVEDVWLEMDEVSHIILETDESLFPDDRIQFYFDSETELLYTREGYYDGEDFVEVKRPAVTSYQNILGFMLKKPTSQKAPYRVSASV